MTKSPLFRDFLTGLFALASVAGLCLTLILFGEASNLLERHYTFRVLLTNAAGLGQTSPVRLNGVKVGQVKRAAIRTAPEVGAEITVEVRAGVTIPRTARVSVDKGFVGDASLEFSIDPRSTAAQLADVLREGDVFDGGSPQTLMDKITATVEGPLQRLSETAESIEKLAKTYNTVGERLAEMLEPRTPEEVDGGKPPNVRSTLARLDKALAGADAWLSDEDLRRRTKDLVARADKAIEDASRLAEAWRQTAGKVDAAAVKLDGTAEEAKSQIAAVAAQAVSMLRKAEEAAGSLAAAAETASRGPGTVGQLMQNPDLYHSLKSSADRLDAVLLELQLLIEKYKAEGIPIKL
jgi:phospholipid/cholesterol/gamma-HCH transport system substrate-binding protein